MVGLLVRLKLRILGHAASRSGWQLAGMLIGLAYAAGAVLAALAGLAALSLTDAGLIGDATVPAYTVLTVLWTLLSVLVFGTDATLDPGRFALLPLRARELLPGLLAATMVSVGGLATVLLGLGLVVAWWAHPLALISLVVALPLGLATCFLLMRVVTSGLARVLSSRRFRDLAAILVAVLGIGVALAATGLSQFFGTGPDPAELRATLGRLAQVAGWTPWGWAWAVPADAARGDLGAAALHLVLAAGLAALLWWAWERLLARALTEPLEAAHAGAVSSSPLVERLFGTSPAGAVAARSVRYRRRDPRYLGFMLMLVLVPAVIGISTIATSSGDGSRTALLAAPLLAAMLASQGLVVEIPYDGPALWLHVTTGIRGADDRWGRLLAALAGSAPILVPVTAIAIWYSGRPDLAVATVALTVGGYLGGMGGALWVGAVFQGTAPPPGSDPFKGSSVGGLEGAVASFLTVALVGAAALVVGVPALASLWVPWLAWVALALALVGGWACLVAGARIGGRRLDGTWPEVLAKAANNS